MRDSSGRFIKSVEDLHKYPSTRCIPRSKETKRKISDSKKGVESPLKGRKKGPFSEEHKKRISLAKTKIPDKYCNDCGKKLKNKKATFCKPCSKKGNRNTFYNKIHSQKTREMISKANKGRKRTEEFKLKCRNRIRPFGKDSSSYIDGRTPLNHTLRNIRQSIEWRNDIFKRDNYICQECFKRGGKLHPHHKKAFSIILSEFLKEYNQFSPIDDKHTLLRLASKYKSFWDIDNGITLCKKCHRVETNKNLICSR